jgi:signal transduction histidine kinase
MIPSEGDLNLPRRLLREPHVLAHELRTPLSLLAGWCSLMQGGDIHPDRTPEQWQQAMEACEQAVARLNILISEACDEAQALRQLQSSGFRDMVEMTSAAIQHARQIREEITRSRTKAASARVTSRPFGPLQDRPQPTAD